MSFLRFTDIKFWSGRLPILLQTESAECGLACLGMISGFFGHRIDLASLRRRFSISLKGMTLRGLITIADGMQLQTRPVRLEVEHVDQLKLPCILHWDLNHFVVLKSIGSRKATIHDPAMGERVIGLQELAKHFTGVALELSPGELFEKKVELQRFSLFSLMGNVVGLKRALLQILLLGVGLEICSLAGPFYMQWIVDEALLTEDRDLVAVLGIGFILLVVLQVAIASVRTWATKVLSTNLNFQWLGNVFSHLMRLPLHYFEKRHTGDIVSRFGSVQIIQMSLTTQFVEGMIDGILVVGTLSVMLLYNPQLTFLAVATVLIYGMMRWAIFRQIREANTEQIAHAAKQQTHFMETVRGIQSVRLFNRTIERRSGWLNSLAEQYNADIRSAKLTLGYTTAKSLLFGVERVLVIWLAALAVMNNSFSVGMLFAFISFKEQFSGRLTALIDRLIDFQMLKLHGDRVADIVLTKTEPDEQHMEIELADSVPEIEIRNLSFRYSDTDPFVLKDLNLTILAGQSIAITGASGCGKTTFLKLLLGLFEPTEGDIFVDGVPIRQFGLTNYRTILGTVMQDDNLFVGSISDNISFFDDAPDDSRIEGSAMDAAIHNEISSMPMGYHTFVGDLGSGLSGGQKQRILLARALYRRPKLLVLDEATSHLDSENEKLVNASIAKLKLTRVIVAHRLETIGMAERVVTLSDGVVIDDKIGPILSNTEPP